MAWVDLDEVIRDYFVTTPLEVAGGGTGGATHVANAVLLGNGGDAIKNVPTASGALYATTANGAPQFGTLPLPQGGTGGNTAATARENLEVYSKEEIDTLLGGGLDVTVWYDTKTDGEFYKADAAPDSTTVGKYDGYFYATRVYNAVWNDYAELFEKVEEIEIGHIAYVQDDGRVGATGKPSCAVGVVSDQWGYLVGGNGDHDPDDHVAIGLAGRVPIEIIEEIEVGDMIAATSDGRGRKASAEDIGCTLGKCVGPDPKGRDNYVLMMIWVR